MSGHDPIPQPLELSYAPPVRNSYRRFLVIPFGLLTTAVSLTAVYFISRRMDSDLMGWFVFYVIPVGAICAGAAAGLGYFIAGQIAGLRVRRHVFALVLVLQIVAY